MHGNQANRGLPEMAQDFETRLQAVVAVAGDSHATAAAEVATEANADPAQVGGAVAASNPWRWRAKSVQR